MMSPVVRSRQRILAIWDHKTRSMSVPFLYHQVVTFRWGILTFSGCSLMVELELPKLQIYLLDNVTASLRIPKTDISIYGSDDRSWPEVRVAGTATMWVRECVERQVTPGTGRSRRMLKKLHPHHPHPQHSQEFPSRILVLLKGGGRG